MTIAIIGGGAAGYFGAIAAAEAGADVILLEKSKQPLAKVRISGGGRCNTTHACFEPSLLVKNYPRGEKALRGPFSRFQPRDTIEWFAERGVTLKTEEDGRMFPITDSSETIINCLTQAAEQAGVDIRLHWAVESLQKQETGFIIQAKDKPALEVQKVLLATGSHPQPCSWAEQLGHTLMPPVPSLFTFNIPGSPLVDLAGISLETVEIKILNTSLQQSGPLLITHWGFSGPAVLKLSAWGARNLHNLNYEAQCQINWLPSHTLDALQETLRRWKQENPKKQLGTDSPFTLAKKLWRRLVELSGIDPESRWATLPGNSLQTLCNKLHADRYQIRGKTTFKEEFVTCGGICLDEVNFKTMESKLVPGLYFAGEILDIDGITGGFNFQNAWTTGWLAGNAMAS